MASTDKTRRNFIIRMAQYATLTSAGGSLWAYLLQQQAHANNLTIRPPGALDEKEFNAACIKCGQCVRACPFDTLKLADTSDSIAIGTPFFTPREIPCYMCKDIPCVKACPTGALAHDLTNIDDARMGLAVLDTEHCISYLGLRCEICHRVCPVQDKAITLKHVPREKSKHAMFLPIVNSQSCTGCGVCEEACPTEQASIKVVKAEMVQGKIGDHYRLGWKNNATITQEFKSPERKDSSKDTTAEGLDYFNMGEDL